MDFLIKELKKKGYIRDRGNVRNGGRLVHHEVSPETVDDFVKFTKLDKHLSGLSIATRRALFKEQKFVKSLLTLPKLEKNLMDAKLFIEKVKNNKAYEEIVVNFCHSKDLTVSLFNHVGSVYLIDKKFEQQKEVRSPRFLKNVFLFTKSVKDYHLEDVFIPFLITEGEKRGKFSHHLNIDFIASLLRKIIHFERQEDKELLIRYYKRETLDSEIIPHMKNLLKEGLRKSKDDLLYAEQAIEAIEKFEDEDMKLTWERMKGKLASPYEAVDLYDIIVFRH